MVPMEWARLLQEGEEEYQSRPPVPADGFGLGLTGNRDNYYDVRNSMLHQARDNVLLKPAKF
jgi:hypothetical protein